MCVRETATPGYLRGKGTSVLNYTGYSLGSLLPVFLMCSSPGSHYPCGSKLTSLLLFSLLLQRLLGSLCFSYLPCQFSLPLTCLPEIYYNCGSPHFLFVFVGLHLFILSPFVSFSETDVIILLKCGKSTTFI